MSTRIMSKLVFSASGFALLLLVLLANSSVNFAAQLKSKIPDTRADTLQRMIVENGSITMQLDLNRLNGISSAGKTATFNFAVAANSFFSVLVFNDQLRGTEEGSMTLVPTEVNAFGRNNLPVALGTSFKQLVVEKLPSNQNFDFAVRDIKTSFVFFNVEGGDYHYDANAKSLGISDGRLLISKEFASALGRPSDAGLLVGRISVGAAMQAIEIDRLDANGNLKSASLPALHQPGLGTVPGPDVIVGELLSLV